MRQLFSNISLELIQRDLRQTHSVEMTIENILEDRLSSVNRHQNLLNFDDEYEDDDEEEENSDNSSSTDDDRAQRGASNNTDNSSFSNQSALANLRRRNNFFSWANFFLLNCSYFKSFLNGNSLNSASATEAQLNNNNNRQDPNMNTDNIVNDQLNNINDDTAIYSKYSTSPKFSENANDLIKRKRDLILNSKK